MNDAGTVLVVGSCFANGDNGRICIYDYNMDLNDWNAEPTKVIESEDEDGFFGYDVVLNAVGDRLVVSQQTYSTNKGQVWIYHYNYTTNEWYQKQVITGPNDDHFGWRHTGAARLCHGAIRRYVAVVPAGFFAFGLW